MSTQKESGSKDFEPQGSPVDQELDRALHRFYDAQDELRAATKALKAAERARVQGTQRRIPGVR